MQDADALAKLEAKASSQSRDAQVEDYLTHELAHTMLLDPALLVANGLGLPTLTFGTERCYCRMTLLVRHGVFSRDTHGRGAAHE